MRRFVPVAIVVGLVLTGCHRAPTVVVVPPPAPLPTPEASSQKTSPAPTPPPIPTPLLSAGERHDIAVWKAAAFLTDHRYPEALAALEQAKKALNSDLIRQEIARVKLREDAARAAERIIGDIQIVLSIGGPEDAVRLATRAVMEFGESDAGETVIRLKRQADALANAVAPNTAAQYRREADEAARAKALRIAAMAYEQAVAAGDATAAAPLAAAQSTLAAYDDARRRAAEFRRDPLQLDEALAALRAAAAAWDTPQIRQEIDDFALALRYRRDRIGVAEFEIRGDIGVPLFGPSVAEELLPAFKNRLDLVDSGQVARLCSDLKVRGPDLIDRDGARQEFARLGRARYLVVGSVAPVGGITAQAWLLDLQTGLVVQSAKITAPTAYGLIPLLPRLAAMLQLTDDQRLAYERDSAKQAAPIPPAAADLAISPPPERGGTTSSPVPMMDSPRPPDLGGAAISDLRMLPPPGRASTGFDRSLTADCPLRDRAVNVALELGDALFRAGITSRRAHSIR